MSSKTQKETKVIRLRELTIADKGRIRKLLKHGEISKISCMKGLPGYQQCLNVINPNHPSENDRVWEAAIRYLNNLPKIELDERLARYIKTGVAA
jgi:hypothetical protein